VFRYATEREVAAVTQACDEQDIEQGKTAADKLTAAVETFAQRALLGRTLAYSLIAEPVDPSLNRNDDNDDFIHSFILATVLLK
jgi:hypothetical protein